MAGILNQLTTDEAKELFLTLLGSQRGNITNTCEATGVSRQTYYDWREQDPKFRARLATVTEERIDMVEDALLLAIQSMDVTAIRYFLDAQAKSRGYGQASKLEVSGPGGGPIPGTVDMHHYPPEPDDIRAWEAQAAEARKARKIRELEEAKTKDRLSVDTDGKLPTPIVVCVRCKGTETCSCDGTAQR